MDNQIHKKVELTVLSPVHIGSGGSKWTKADYFYEKGKKEVHIIDPLKWMDFLEEQGRVEEYLRYIQQSMGEKTQNKSKRNSNTNEVDNLKYVRSFLPGFKAEGSSLVKYTFPFSYYRESADSYKASTKGSTSKIDAPLKEIAPLMRDGFGRCYIPGSSLKGSLRSNHLRMMLERNTIWRTSLEKELLSKKKELLPPNVNLDDEKKFEYFHKEVEKIINRYEGQILPKEESFLSLSDVYPIAPGETQTVLYQDYDYLLGTGEATKPIPLIREYLPVGTVLQGEMGISRAFLAKLEKEQGIPTVEAYMKALQAETDRIFADSESLGGAGNEAYENTKEILRKDKDQDLLLILGANTGFHQKTILWPIFQEIEDALDVTKAVLHEKHTRKVKGAIKVNPMTSHWEDKDYSPRALNTVKWKGQDVLAGLIGLRVLP